KPGLYGRVAARLARVPVVVNTVHGLYAQPEDRWAKKAVVYTLERLAAACSDAELVQNPEDVARSEEHTSELQSRENLVCRLLLLARPPRSTLFPTRRSSDLEARAVRARRGAPRPGPGGGQHRARALRAAGGPVGEEGGRLHPRAARRGVLRRGAGAEPRGRREIGRAHV